MIHHWKGAGESETNRAKIAVRIRAVLHLATAEHLRLRFQLHVNFQAYGYDVVGGHKILS